MSVSPHDFVDHYLETVDGADPAALKALYAPDARVFDAMGTWELRGEAWFDRIDEWLGHCRPGGANRVQDVSVVDGGDLAAVAATITYDAELVDGNRGSCTLRFNAVLRREDNSWLIVQEHSSFPVTMEAEPKVITFGGEKPGY